MQYDLWKELEEVCLIAWGPQRGGQWAMAPTAQILLEGASNAFGPPRF